MKSTSYYLLILFICFISACTDSPQPTNPSDKLYPSVKSILIKNCNTCHSASGAWEGRPTAFDTDYEIVSDAAAIKKAVTDTSFGTKRMPPNRKLLDGDIAIIVKWVEKGGRISD